jgi:hypothetical protein
MLVHHGREPDAAKPRERESTEDSQGSWLAKRLQSNEAAVDFSHEANMEEFEVGFSMKAGDSLENGRHPGQSMLETISETGDAAFLNGDFQDEALRRSADETGSSYRRQPFRPNSMWNVKGYEGFISRAARKRTSINGYRRNSGLLDFSGQASSPRSRMASSQSQHEAFPADLEELLSSVCLESNTDSNIKTPSAGARKLGAPGKSDYAIAQAGMQKVEEEDNQYDSLTHCPLKVRRRVRQWHTALKDYSWEQRAPATVKLLSSVSRLTPQEGRSPRAKSMHLMSRDERSTVLRSDDPEIVQFRQENIWEKPAEWWGSLDAFDEEEPKLSQQTALQGRARVSASEGWKQSAANEGSNFFTGNGMLPLANKDWQDSTVDKDGKRSTGNEDWKHSTGNEDWQQLTANDDLEEFFASLKLNRPSKESTVGYSGAFRNSKLESVAVEASPPSSSQSPISGSSNIGLGEDHMDSESNNVDLQQRWPGMWPQAADDSILAQLIVPDPFLAAGSCYSTSLDENHESKIRGGVQNERTVQEDKDVVHEVQLDTERRTEITELGSSREMSNHVLQGGSVAETSREHSEDALPGELLQESAGADKDNAEDSWRLDDNDNHNVASFGSSGDRTHGGQELKQRSGVMAGRLAHGKTDGFDDDLRRDFSGIEEGWWDRQASPVDVTEDVAGVTSSGQGLQEFDDIFGPSYGLKGMDEDLFGGKEWIGPETAPHRSGGSWGAGRQQPDMGPKYSRQASQTRGFSYVIGDREFLSSSGLRQYFQRILRQHAPLTAMQQNDILDLIYQGHPDPESKLGAGVVEVFVGGHPMHGSPCFLLRRRDKSIVDVSFNKCVTSLAERGGRRRGNGSLHNNWAQLSQ